MPRDVFARLTLITTALALCVVVLGAYVRLSNAGLGCPDWPGCYGHIGVPQGGKALSEAQQEYPSRPVEAHKAWKEMVHRYFAGTLGLLILTIAIVAWQRRIQPGQQLKIPLLLVVVVIFQALLGMWTVTLLLKPLVVMGHLIGGMTTLALLWWLSLRHTRWLTGPEVVLPTLRHLALIGLVVVVVQIMLGGWTSTNYAALACPDFPTCQGKWWPNTDFANAFTLWGGLGINYEGGVLDNAARLTIHLTHRIGALVTFIYMWTLAIAVYRRGHHPALRRISLALMAVVSLQVLLGIGNVVLGLPLPVAVTHNGVAALLLLTIVTLNHSLRSSRGG